MAVSDARGPGRPPSQRRPRPAWTDPSGAWGWDVVEAAPDGMVVGDERGRIAYVNGRLEAMSGYGREELVGHPVEVLVPEGVRTAHRGYHRDFRLSPRIRPMGTGADVHLRCRDGSLLVVEISLAPLLISDRPMTVAAVRRVSEAHAAQSERRRLLETLDLVPDAVVMSDATTHLIEYVNHAAAQIFGHAEAELVGSPIATLRREDADDPDRTVGDRATIDERERVVSVVVRSAAGELIPLEVHERVVTDDSGAAHVIEVSRDIRERQAAQERLRASEESFRIAFDKAPVGVAVVRIRRDGHRTIVRANRALADMLHESVASLEGDSFETFTLPEDEAQGLATAAAMASGDLPETVVLKRYRRRDGSLLWADVHAALVSLPDLPGRLALLQLVDVTERHEAEALRRSQAALTELVADVATAVLAAEPEREILDRVVRGAAELLAAESAALVLGDDTTGTYTVAACVGGALAGLPCGQDPVPAAMVDTLLRGQRAYPGPPSDMPAELTASLGPLAVAPFGRGSTGLNGILLVARAPVASRSGPTRSIGCHGWPARPSWPSDWHGPRPTSSGSPSSRTASGSPGTCTTR